MQEVFLHMENGDKKVDSKRIAQVAGVSRSTVSRVLNQPQLVKPETRERVMEAINTFDYTPNLSAQLLTDKKPFTIGLFQHANKPSTKHMLEDSHLDYIVRLVLSAASMRGYHTLVTLVFDMDDPEIQYKITEMFHQHRIEAGIFIGFPDEYPTIEKLVADGYCVGIFDGNVDGKTEANRIVCNFDEHTGENAVDYLVSLGHRDICALHGDLNRFNGRQKYEGFLRGMQTNGLDVRPEWNLRCDFSMDKAFAQITALAESGKLPSAIFATNDSIAFSAMQALANQGLEVPRQVSVVGVDDSYVSRFYTPALTTFRINFKQMLGMLTTKVIEYANKPFERQYVGVFGSVLVERDSCLPYKAP